MSDMIRTITQRDGSVNKGVRHQVGEHEFNVWSHVVVKELIPANCPLLSTHAHIHTSTHIHSHTTKCNKIFSKIILKFDVSIICPLSFFLSECNKWCGNNGHMETITFFTLFLCMYIFVNTGVWAHTHMCMCICAESMSRVSSYHLSPSYTLREDLSLEPRAHQLS